MKTTTAGYFIIHTPKVKKNHIISAIYFKNFRYRKNSLLNAYIIESITKADNTRLTIIIMLK